jgi:glycosyltransferase involved in cell wall biosynthesis
VKYLLIVDNPTVGLVMAAYNSLSFIEESIQSIMNQDFTDFACCIVDDGSTDGTNDVARELVRNDNRFMVVEQHHSGVSAARNFGASQLPETKYLSFPDSDDVWRSDALRTLVESAELFGGVGAHALADEIDSTGAPLEPGVSAQFQRERFVAGYLRKHAVPLDSPSTFESLVQSCTLYPPGLVLTRRDVFEKVSGFDLSLWQSEDWDLYIRISRNGDYAFVNEVVVDYRRHSDQSTKYPWIKEMDMVVRAKTLLSPFNTPLQRKAALKVWRSWTFLSPLRQGHSALGRLKQRQFEEAATALRGIPKEFLRCLTGPGHVQIPERYSISGK